MPAVQITTRYHGPTDTRGSRITANALGRRATVPYDYAAKDPHAIAAQALADKLGLSVPVYAGTHNAGNVYRAESEV